MINSVDIGMVNIVPLSAEFFNIYGYEVYSSY
jgi:hypothetical protein